MLQLHAIPEPVAALLDRLASRDALKPFALGGGTSLALRFGHRLSVDLDYFTTEEFDPGLLSESLDLDDISVLAMSTNTLSLVASGVKIDFLRHNYPEVTPIDEIAGHRLVSVPDLAAMKLNAIANRGSKKDFYDMVELLLHHSLNKMLGFFSTKYPTTDSFAVIRSLVWFEDAEYEPDPIPLNGQTWSEVKQWMIQAVRKL